MDRRPLPCSESDSGSRTATKRAEKGTISSWTVLTTTLGSLRILSAMWPDACAWEHKGPAQRFYQTMGFKRTGEHTFTLGENIQTDWIMTASVN